MAEGQQLNSTEKKSEKDKEICWEGVEWSKFKKDNEEYFNRIVYDSKGNWIYTWGGSPRYYEFGKLKIYHGASTEPFERRDKDTYELVESEERWKELRALWEESSKSDPDISWALEERKFPFKGFLGEGKGKGRFIKRRGNYKILPIHEWEEMIKNYSERKRNKGEEGEEAHDPEGKRYGHWTELPDWEELREKGSKFPKLKGKEKGRRRREIEEQSNTAAGDQIRISREVNERKSNLVGTFRNKTKYVASLDIENVSAQEVKSLRELQEGISGEDREIIKLDEYDHSNLFLDGKEKLRSEIAVANEEIARERDMLLSELEDFFRGIKSKPGEQEDSMAVLNLMPEGLRQKLEEARKNARAVIEYYRKGLEAADGIHAFYDKLYDTGPQDKFHKKIEELENELVNLDNYGDEWNMPERVSRAYMELQSLDPDEALKFSREAREVCLQFWRVHLQEAEKVLAEKEIGKVIDPERIGKTETEAQRERRQLSQLKSRVASCETVLHANALTSRLTAEEYRRKQDALMSIETAATSEQAKARIAGALQDNTLPEDDARSFLSAIDMEESEANDFISQNRPDSENNPEEKEMRTENMDDEAREQINTFIVQFLRECNETEEWQKHMDLEDRIDLLRVESGIFLMEILSDLEESRPGVERKEYLSKTPAEIINAAFEKNKEAGELILEYREYLKNLGREKKPTKEEEKESRDTLREWDGIIRRDFEKFRTTFMKEVERTETWQRYMNDRSREKLVLVELKIFIRQLIEDTGMEIHPKIREKYIQELLKS